MENPGQKALEAINVALSSGDADSVEQLVQQQDQAPAPAIRRSTVELLEAVFRRLHPAVANGDGRTPMEKAIDEHHQMRADLITLTDEFRVVLHERDVLEANYENERSSRIDDAERFDKTLNGALNEIVRLREKLAEIKTLATTAGGPLLQMVKACQDAADTNPEAVRAYRPNLTMGKIATEKSE